MAFPGLVSTVRTDLIYGGVWEEPGVLHAHRPSSWWQLGERSPLGTTRRHGSGLATTSDKRQGPAPKPLGPPSIWNNSPYWYLLGHDFFLKIFSFIIWEIERQTEHGQEQQREWERQSHTDSVLSVELHAGLNPMILRSWPESKPKVRHVIVPFRCPLPGQDFFM